MKILPEIKRLIETKKLRSELEKLTLRQKIAQLIHIPAWSNRGQEHLDSLTELVESYEVGGIIFFQGDAHKQSSWTHTLQERSKLPLLISIDAEWGLGMRLDRSPAFPFQMTFGALKENDLIYEMGLELGRQLREIGVHINFAPDVDINTQPGNPVIGFRSFGADPLRVSEKALAYARGLEDAGILPVIKHFPGHGDTRLDSHLALPVLDHAVDRLEEVELVPFRKLIREGIPAVMSAHLYIPAWETQKDVPTTHSRKIIQNILRQELGFEGLLFTDALDMKAVSATMSPADINLKAALAGHDALLFCIDVPGSIDAIEKAVEAGSMSEEEINLSCLKVLASKELLCKPATSWNPSEAFERTNRIRLNVAEKALTWHRPPANKINPTEAVFLDLNMKGEQEENLAHHQLGFAGGIIHQTGKWWKDYLANEKGLRFGDMDASTAHGGAESVVLVHGLDLKARNQFGMNPEVLEKLGQLLLENQCHIVWMGSPYGLHFVPNLAKALSILLTYQEGIEFEKAAAAVILDEIKAVGKLPVSGF